MTVQPLCHQNSFTPAGKPATSWLCPGAGIGKLYYKTVKCSQQQYSLNSHIPFYNYNPPLCSSMCYLDPVAISCIIWPECVTSTRWGHHVTFSVKSKDGLPLSSDAIPSFYQTPSLFLSFFLSLPVSILLPDSLSLEIDAKCFIKKTQYSSPCFARGVPFSYGLAILPARISPYASRLTLFFISTFLKSN